MNVSGEPFWPDQEPDLVGQILFFLQDFRYYDVYYYAKYSYVKDVLTVLMDKNRTHSN